MAVFPSLLAAVVALSSLFVEGVSAASLDRVPDSFFEAEPQAELNLRGSNGYSIDILAIGTRVSLDASGKHGGASYEVPQEGVTPDRIEAQFGDLGRVAVEFRAMRTIRERPPRGCRGGELVIRFGVFVGTIEFAGEKGYTKVIATQAKGRTEVTEVLPGRECLGRWSEPVSLSDKSPETGEKTLLVAETKKASARHAYFQAERITEPGKPDQTIFLAGQKERQGNMSILRSGYASARVGAFDFNDELAVATVDPPQPFAGTGTLRRDRQGEAKLIGSLTVSVPGADERIVLTGPRFRVGLISMPWPPRPPQGRS